MEELLTDEELQHLKENTMRCGHLDVLHNPMIEYDCMLDSCDCYTRERQTHG